MKVLRLVSRLRSAFAKSLKVRNRRKRELSIELSKSAGLKDLVYWLQIFFAAGIATLGLVLNSPAVIIGAMLISPLMGPILSTGLALATGDLILGIRGVINLLLSCLAAISFAVILVALLPFKEMTAEISSRTSPNTLDLIVALFSGAIGSIATCREPKGVVTSIPGVAIAVALMPPLCVVGYGIGLALSFNFSEGMNAALGGGLLFLTNLFAITFMAMVVFWLLRIDTGNVRKALEEWRNTDSENHFVERVIKRIPVLEDARIVRSIALRLLMILIPLIVIIVPLTSSFSKLKSEIFRQRAENQIKQTALSLWQENFEKLTNGDERSYVESLSITENKEKLNISLRVFDNETYTEEEKKLYIRLLATKLSYPTDKINFQLIEIPTSRLDKPLLETQPIEISLTELHKNFVEKADSSLVNLAFPTNAKLLDHQFISDQKANLIVKIWYLSEIEFSQDAKDLISQNIRQSLQNSNVGTELILISNQPVPLSFIKNTDQITEPQILETFAALLELHDKLTLNISLKKTDENELELFENRKKVLNNFFTVERKINSKRITFNESEADSSIRYESRTK